MGFLDNLENNLKSLESHEDGKESAERQQRTRDNDRANAQAIAPHAEALKKRTKVHVAWLGNTRRLEARERRLDLRPTAKGIVAAYTEEGREVRTEPLDLKGSPEQLVRDWLAA